jgi:nitrate/nitrite-specific signal transduction histidine kinase
MPLSNKGGQNMKDRTFSLKDLCTHPEDMTSDEIAMVFNGVADEIKKSHDALKTKVEERKNEKFFTK